MTCFALFSIGFLLAQGIYIHSVDGRVETGAFRATLINLFGGWIIVGIALAELLVCLKKK